MHYDFVGIFQGGTLPLFADSENEQYACTRYLYVCYDMDIYASSKLILHSVCGVEICFRAKQQ